VGDQPISLGTVRGGFDRASRLSDFGRINRPVGDHRQSGPSLPALEKQWELLLGGVTHLVTAPCRQWHNPDRTTIDSAFVFGRMGNRPDRI
jgi:hypothetical protein